MQDRYSAAAMAAINHMIQLEPKLSRPTTNNDVLRLELMPDSAGQQGDVRDILFIRSTQNWEIGISAKNNHKAVKHNRLSNTLDFGQEWLGIPCSQDYFNRITPIFNQLRNLKAQSATWSSVPNKYREVYMPVLEAFRDELINIDRNHQNVAQVLANYLIGSHDFYKVIRKARTVEIYGFNLHNTLGRQSGQTRSSSVITRLRLPTQIIQFAYKPNSATTLILTCDAGWQISFRIHSAETLVIPSLKFDINLVGSPNSMYAHHLAY
jgi:hypothetical protein